MPQWVQQTLEHLIRDSIRGESKLRVAIEQLCLPRNQDIVGLMNLSAKVQAVELTWLRSDLDMGTNRPAWAFLADALIARHAPIRLRNLDVGLSRLEYCYQRNGIMYGQMR